WKSQNKVRIVYAPHHSFRHSILKWATYEWSGAHLIQLAKDHQDTTEWIFKPHPRFYITLVEEFGQEFADSVFEQWTQVSRLYDQGDYFDLFKTADLMISDCGSFQIEWLPTHKPYIHLVSNYPDAEPDGQLKKHFSSGYYLAHSIKELDDYFQQLVVLKQDPKREKREELIREIPLNASEVVFSYVKQLIAPTP
ncbi:MAG: CDP-glycerol glycerophosphotransferase family protein, partial [Pseudomonadota bacterium]|nr:CDP-glycerol glycerophosphotransferase family protein [Pseudomonadota bacterium]